MAKMSASSPFVGRLSLARKAAAVSLGLTGGDGRVVAVHELRAGDQHDDRDDHQATDGDRGLGAELAPGEADHGRTSERGERRRLLVLAWLM